MSALSSRARAFIPSVVAIGLSLFVFDLVMDSAEGATLLHVDCQPQSPIGTGARGTLVVTEFAVLRARSPCPTERLNPDETIAVRRSDPLWLWVRLEGDIAYLDLPTSSAAIALVVGREANGPQLDEAYDIAWIDNSTARDEALATAGGIFDWRIDGYKTMYWVPGIYYLELHQAGTRICFKVVGRNFCRLKVSVSE